MHYIDSNLQLVSESNDAIKGNTYRAKFLERGIVKYVDDGNHYLPNDAFRAIASSFVGYPAIMSDHDVVTPENVTQLADCYISAVDFEDGYAYATFTSNNPLLHEKMGNGDVYVSCSYKNDDIDSEGIHNGIDYKYVITANGLKPNHIAIGVEKPRYGDATVEKINSTKETKTMGMFNKDKEEKETKDATEESKQEEKKDDDKKTSTSDDKKDNAAFSEDQMSAIKSMIAEAVKGMKDNADDEDDKKDDKKSATEDDKEEDKKEAGQKNNTMNDFISSQQQSSTEIQVSVNSNPNDYRI